MTDPRNSADTRIKEEFERARKEYAAFDRTLDALAALRTILDIVREIAEETELIDFRPKLEAAELDAGPYTPDGILILKGSSDFIVELKTSWNETDIAQVLKYARSPAYFFSGERRPFKPTRCLLLGYQNPPGERNLDELFDSWESSKFGFPLVLVRYSLEQGPAGDRMYFSRIAYKRNGECPPCSLGKAFNSTRGVAVSVDRFKVHRSRFHKTNDQAIASYAAVLWWTKYVSHYLSEEQKSEMAERGRLSSPLIVGVDKINEVPTMPDVEVPLGPRDIRNALEFLRQAKLVALKTRANVFEVEVKEDRFIRLPQGSPISRGDPQIDISLKILARWATHKVKNPVRTSKKVRRGGARRGLRRDDKTRDLFPR